MSALVPREAVTLLYRRYIKAAHKVSNATIRMVLLQQIRRGFARHRFLLTPESQKELIEQAHKDLLVLEDERLSRTLFINNLGMVSCIDWQSKRVRYEFSSQMYTYMKFYAVLFFSVWIYAFMTGGEVETVFPDIAEMVETMQNQLEASSHEEFKMKQEDHIRRSIEERAARDDLERRILATFYNAPKVNVMSMLDSDDDQNLQRAANESFSAFEYRLL